MAAICKNRQAVTLFDPIDSAKGWVSQKTNKAAKADKDDHIMMPTAQTVHDSLPAAFENVYEKDD